ncbi:MAG: ATP-binding cassette domain-containing protein, partial [Chloroflexi bacterium]|nr:ATP-binding cassette domain-containing protein [Chloroflexota bacterium]
MSTIQTDKLTKVFPGGITAVDAIDFEVREGEIFGFLGPNGAGKTTTIKMLNTLIRPTSGTAVVAGFDVVKHPAEVRRSIGYVAQDVGIDEHATGRENLTLYGRFYRLDGKTIKERVDSLFALVDLASFEDKMVSTYSGGMRKRLDIAMGLIHQPKLIFLDEPTVGLDPQTRARMWEYIQSLARTMGITIFLTTHYMDEADKLADRIAIIDRGKIMTIGTPDELKRSIGGDVVTLSPCGTGEPECAAFMERTRSVLSGQQF